MAAYRPKDAGVSCVAPHSVADGVHSVRPRALAGLQAALGRCTTREAWCDLLVSALLAALPADHAVISLADEPARRRAPAPDGDGVSSAELSAPVRVAGRTVAVLVVGAPRQERGFTRADAHRLAEMAHLAGRSWPLAASGHC